MRDKATTKHGKLYWKDRRDANHGKRGWIAGNPRYKRSKPTRRMGSN